MRTCDQCGRPANGNGYTSSWDPKLKKPVITCKRCNDSNMDKMIKDFEVYQTHKPMIDLIVELNS